MILICYGTRPEWIKIKPLIYAFQGIVDFRVLYTGQHEHIGNFYHDYSIKIGKSKDRLNSIMSSLMEFQLDRDIEYVLVQGDTASTYAMALWAFNRNIKIIHLEAGLRTYDLQNPYPEEGYRQMISRVANIHLCATLDNKENLLKENCHGDIYVVGNTVLDNLKNVETNYGNEILVTMHRRENHHMMDRWFSEINDLAKNNRDLVFTIPIHPNPNVIKHKDILSDLNVIGPLPYEDMIERISKCRFLISDSGGIQEESSFLNKKVIVCRKWTERNESVGIHSFMCKRPELLGALFQEIKDNYKINEPSPYGDGNASKKIVNILKEKI